MTDYEKFLIEADYQFVRQTDSGHWLALQRMMYTTGLFVIDDGDTIGWRCRFCYEHFHEALAALLQWDGFGDDPPGPWVKTEGT